ncbi:hypothetical protein ACWEP8_32965 [Streptomyces hydrogenans]
MSDAAKIRSLIGRDVSRYLVVFCGVWVVFIGVFMAPEGGAVGDYVVFFAGLLLILGLPSLLLVAVARLLALKRDVGAFVAVCGTLLLLPALFPLLAGAWPATLVQWAVLIGFLAWSAWRTQSS